MYNYEIYKIIKILEDEDLNKILKLIQSCSRNSDWQDGNFSFSGEEGTKKNLELSSAFILNKIRSIANTASQNCKELCDFCFPKSFEGCILSKTETNGYYNTHVDCADTGDYSATIFLSDKDSYEGGELCLWINGKEEKIKLDPGYCVVYPTGTPHRVNKVNSGTRYAFVFWIKSIFKNETILECCRELRSINFDEKPLMIPINEEMKDVLNSFEFKINNVVTRLMRKYGSF